LKNDLQKRLGKEYGVETSSCTTALHLSFIALNISAGDEVICPNLTFIAPANMIQLSEAKTVLVDVEVETWNMDPELVRNAITENTKVIVGVWETGESHVEHAKLL
jgi:perosamine synthetase